MQQKTGRGIYSICLEFSNRQIYIENYRKLILYTDQEIIVDAKDCRVRILGNSLFINYYSKYEMIIIGSISEVLFQ